MSVSRNGVYKIYDHMHVAFPRIIPANHTTNHTHGFEAMFWSMRDILMALASRDDLCFVALSLVCMSIYLHVGHVFLVFLGMEGGKAVRQCHQNDLLVVQKLCIFFVLYLTKLCPSTLFLQKISCPSHTPKHIRYIPRIISKPRFAVPWPSRPLQNRPLQKTTAPGASLV